MHYAVLLYLITIHKTFIMPMSDSMIFKRNDRLIVDRWSNVSPLIFLWLALTLKIVGY